MKLGLSIGMDKVTIYGPCVNLGKAIKLKNNIKSYNQLFTRMETPSGDVIHILDKRLYDTKKVLPRTMSFNETNGYFKVELSSNKCSSNAISDGFNHLNFDKLLENNNSHNEYFDFNPHFLKELNVQNVEIKVDRPEGYTGHDEVLINRVLTHTTLMSFGCPKVYSNGIERSNKQHSIVHYNKTKEIEKKNLISDKSHKDIIRDDIRIKSLKKLRSASGKNEITLKELLYIPKQVEIVLPYFTEARIAVNKGEKVTKKLGDKIFEVSQLLEELNSYTNLIKFKGRCAFIDYFEGLDSAHKALKEVLNICEIKVGQKSYYSWKKELTQASLLNKQYQYGHDYIQIFTEYSQKMIKGLKDIADYYIKLELVSKMDTPFTENLLHAEGFFSDYDASDCIGLNSMMNESVSFSSSMEFNHEN
ncbi:MAG: hypothetical protein COW00_09940 [Bdellovibrio sp. CG12_big_fil_rev_8_21_14_0_65_39_13]|nr:MAG: hypothetical protein COW78_15720 [Bdellovibrio sp. CG22_combo_CG10-13_8_21_14_all_39_27]PIQ59553.1 MAG: hypothetical protein COW00_09940 [Bdellovibrio sp. CG12_big_fil_rev_8_21_14_0_65_39_13]PIR33557.1 MAG: hypothetical protein COV37_15970 [Bdellovibrio sp. CG11_big_fil_rev_8_21_14_0_20_39_38]